MEDKKFFKNVPYPFGMDEEIRLKKRILASLEVKNYNIFPKIVLSFAIILIALSIPFFISNKGKVERQKKVFVANPLKVKSEEIAFKDLPFPLPQVKEEKIEDIPFHIVKVDHSIKLQWQDADAKKYRIKKCIFPPKENGCDYLIETDKNYYLDKSSDDANLVIYIVEAVKG